MTKYVKYLNLRFCKTWLLVLFITLSMIWLTQSLRFIELITSKGIDFLSFMKIIMFLVLPMAYICIPISVLIALIIVVHSMNNDNEIIIIKNAGISNLQIFRAFCVSIVVISLLHYLISFYLLPYSYKSFKEYQFLLKEHFIASAFEEGVFNTKINNITVYTKEKSDSGTYKGIVIYDNRTANSPVTYIAQIGKIYQDGDNTNFLLVNGSRQNENLAKKTITIAKFDSYYFNMRMDSSETMRHIDPNELNIFELLNDDGKTIEKIQSHKVIAIQRIIWPALNLLLALYVLSYQLEIFVKRRAMMGRDLSLTFGGIFLVVIMVFGNNMASKHFYTVYILITFLVLLSIWFTGKLIRNRV